MEHNKKPYSPGKSPSNPAAKKSKVSDGDSGVVERTGAESAGMADVNVAAPGSSAKRSLNLSDTDEPPSWLIQFFEKFATRLEKRMETVISNKLFELTSKVEAQEEKLTACVIELTGLAQEVKKLKEDKENLVCKLDDLENRSRRNNLVFYGVPEEKTDTSAVIKEVLEDFVGLPSGDYNIERCHRTPTVNRGNPELDKPRMIHVCFTTYSAKEKVRKACIQKFRSAQFKEKKLFVSEDFSKRILALRKNKMDAFKKLRSEGKKPFFMFPDKLAFKIPSTGKLQIV